MLDRLHFLFGFDLSFGFGSGLKAICLGVRRSFCSSSSEVGGRAGVDGWIAVTAGETWLSPVVELVPVRHFGVEMRRPHGYEFWSAKAARLRII